MAETELTSHHQLSENKYDNINDDDSDSLSDTFGSFSTNRTEASLHGNATVNIMSTEDILADRISGNPKYWEWEEVKLWLQKKGLSAFMAVFDVKDPISMRQGINGEDLLDITVSELFDQSKPYKAGSKLDINEDDADNSPLIEKLFREITKLQLRAHEDIDEYEPKETTINDLIEMKRRITLFITKWDKILWIDHWTDTQGMEPNCETVAEELGLSISVSSVYIEYYHNLDRIKQKDLDELLMDFNVYNDAIIWWFIIISSLKTYPSKSMWLIFEKVSELTPGSVAIGLLEKYRFVLTRFNSDKLHRICQNIVIGSQYPVCAALRIAKWFNDRARYDVARGELFASIADSYVEAAMDYISLLESDHLATVLLEVKSDIEGLSAMDMALRYKLSSFVANNRVERITTSIMNNFEFLTPHNRDKSFQIDPLSLKLIWRKMFNAPFYLTPLGSYVTSIVLYICYLALFTYLSVQKFRVYDEMQADEVIFWIFNMGYAINETQQMISTGMKKYFSDPSNYFDAIVSIVFIIGLCIRVFALIKGPACTGVDCWHDAKLNTTFVILWSIATITLWLRLVNFCVLSHDLGPMVQMIFRMLNDILTFFEIMLILFLGFTFSLVYILGDTHPDFANPFICAVTLFTSILGNFDFDAFLEQNQDDNDTLLYFAYALFVLYLVIGSLVLLNLLIAMMATTYDNIQKNTTEAITFARFDLVLTLDNDASFMPAPLNMLVLALLAIFYIIEWSINVFRRILCKPYYHLTTWIMPPFMRERKLALNEEILYENCHKFWTITTNRGPTLCKIVRYKPQIMQHYVKFYENESDKAELEIYVSIKSNVQKKHIWLLDLMNLYESGLMSLEQFENVKCDQRWIQKAHSDMDLAKKEKRISPYFICGYCRTYVRESKVSIKNLGRFLKVNDIELKLITKAFPVVCPNCYRVRFDRRRWELIWETISILTFYVFVWPIFFVFFGFVLLLRNLLNPEGLGRDWEAFRTDGFVGCCAKKDRDTIDEVDSDNDGSNKNYCIGHYSDTSLISNLNALSGNGNKLFDPKVRDSLWSRLNDAKGSIDPFLLKNKISHHIMAVSSEDELTQSDFFDIYVNKDTLTRNGGDFLWNEYFKPLTKTIFTRIQKLRHAYIPLQLFSRYPFSVDMLLNDFGQFWDQSPNHTKKVMKQCSKTDLIDALDHLKFLNCANRKERQFILDTIEENINEYKDSKEQNNTIAHKFIKYLSAVASLFQDTRKIKNMLRDVSAAIVERGADASLFSDQLYFLFDDINNAIVSMAFFNSMRTEVVGDALKVELWCVRNTLQSLYFLNNTARKYTLQQHSRIYVSIQELLDIIFKLYSNDISDPEGITKYIQTDADIHDGSESEFDEKEKDETLLSVGTELKPKSAGPMYGQKSLLKMSPYRVRGDTDNDHENDDNKTEEYERELEERQKITQSRMELFHKQEITASAIKTEVTSIFNKLQKRRANKITETTIDYYRRNLEKCRLLQDDESLRYIFEQLSRFAVFNPKQMKKECTFEILKKILCETLVFNSEYKIDEETVPKMVRNNENYIRQLYDHLVSVYNGTEFNSIIMEQTLKYMTLEDTLSIIMLYERIFMIVRQKIIDSADDFVVNHDRFCKFVDPKFNMDESKLIYEYKWSNKTKAASNLFQSVLDIQQHFVTLGQIRQTIDSLLSDVHAMECGELIRIINHLAKKVKNDNQRCAQQRKTYNLDKPDTFNQVSVELEALTETDGKNEEIDSKRSLQEIQLAFGDKTAVKKRRKNPSLQFQHCENYMWLSFIKHMSQSFQMNLLSKTISDALKKEETETKEEKEELTKNFHGKKIIDTILEETEFDIICEKASETEDSKEEEDSQHSEEIKKMRLDVFDTILSFNSRRITLQQLFIFTRKFRAFLRKNKIINEMMQNYDQILTKYSDMMQIATETDKLKQEIIAKNKFERFQQKYFGNFKENKKFKLKNFSAEIEWLYDGIENCYDLCHKIYPFWGSKFINDIYSFMESTEQIQGIYELKCAEFGQLKYSLNVNDESANKLFHIIRFKNRSLSWKQFYLYFKFLLKMKYNVQKAMLKSKNCEDTTVSKDGMKILLEISLNDESEWLFRRVITMNATKVTWGQIRNYLKKMVAVRDDVREFFGDKERDRYYKDNKAEIMDGIGKNVSEHKNESMDRQQTIIETLELLRKDIEQLKKEKNGGF